MNKRELKKKWIESLRSGRYEQGNLRLRTQDDKFCCLGVLADIMEPDGWTLSIGDYVSKVSNSTIRLGIHFPWDLKKQANLIEMNDAGKSFEEIADWIEENISEED